MRNISKIFRAGETRVLDPGTINDSSLPSTQDEQVRIEFRSTLIVDLANVAWALERKSCDPITNERKEEFRSIARHIDQLSECLVEFGVKIQNHTSEPFDSGQSLEVIAFQPTAGISRDVVVETIRPTVYLKGIRLQMGQVVVATPEQTQEANGNE
jgi:hypothetical protein